MDEKIAGLKLQMAQRRESIAKNSGGEVLGKLNEGLVSLTIDITELEQRLDYVQKQLEIARSRRLVQLSDQYEDIMTEKLPLVRESIARATREVEECQRQLNMPGPDVIVVGLK